MIVVNTTAGVIQEVKAGQAIAALSEMTAPEARVDIGELHLQAVLIRLDLHALLVPRPGQCSRVSAVLRELAVASPRS